MLLPALLEKTGTEPSPATSPSWIRALIALGACLFFIALAGSAILIPPLRLLHVYQALIYVAVLILTWRDSAWGFGAAIAPAILWNGQELFITRLPQRGLRQLWLLIHGGSLTRPDAIMVLTGTVGHFLLIIACIAGVIRLRASWRHWGQLLGGAVLAIGYFALIVSIMVPHH
jgi:hypothetical protein